MIVLIIILIALINIPLAWNGNIEYLMYLCGVSLMFNIIKQINNLWR